MKIVLIFICTMFLNINADRSINCQTYNCEIRGASTDFTIYTKDVQVLEVNFVDSILKTFPNQLLDAYPELKKCDISESSMVYLHIKKETKLEWLAASRNQISELSTETFKNIRGIVSLYLPWNEITNLIEGIFDDLPKLEVLDLSHNHITTPHIDTFSKLTSLKFLYLNNNKIERFNLNVSQANNLIVIEGGHNQFDYYNINLPNAYKGLLNLEYNQLTHYKSTLEKGEVKLDGNSMNYLVLKIKSSKVSANFNQISSIEITPDLQIETLLIRDNLLTDIRNITEVVSVQVLDISSNPIKVIEENAFNKMINLRHLTLRNTNLLIPRTFLPAQRNLIYLDISENFIENFDIRSLKYLINLQTLKLECCSTRIIKNYPDQKEIVPALNSISIDGNKLACSFVVQFINHCSTNKIQIMSDPVSIDIKSPNIKGINCNGIDQGDGKDVEKYQWQELYRPMISKELKLQNSSTEVENQFKILTEKSYYIEIFCFIMMVFAGVNVCIAFALLIFCCRRSKQYKFVHPNPVIKSNDDSRCSYYIN